MMDIFGLAGVPLNPSAQLHGVQNCKNPYNNCLGNYIPYQTTQRPLDECFADFKVRLAAANIES